MTWFTENDKMLSTLNRGTMIIKNNESCQNPKCGEPLSRGYVEMRTASGEWRRICFDCARAELEITNALTEIEMEEEE